MVFSSVSSGATEKAGGGFAEGDMCTTNKSQVFDGMKQK